MATFYRDDHMKIKMNYIILFRYAVKHYIVTNSSADVG